LTSITPKIESEAITKNYGRFVVAPLETGYGITIGNALRRVLLSSLPGAAVTSLSVSGVPHEFSEIPNAKEDMTRLILNVKQLRLRSYADGPVTMRVSASGKAIVTAGDIEAPGDVEIINPELPLLSLDSPGSDLEIEFTVEKGRGYSPAEERGKLPIGQIPVDAIYSPVLKASYTVGRTRIGQMTDFDRLVIEVTTDGTMAPAEALSQAAEILVKHFATVSSFGATETLKEEARREVEEIPSRIYEMAIEDLGLSMRAYNCLKRANIAKVGEVLERLSKGVNEVLSIRNFGRKSLEELFDQLEKKGIAIPEAARANPVIAAQVDGEQAEEDEGEQVA
jgi:DNA-directed RNA polymerase subunit alpha